MYGMASVDIDRDGHPELIKAPASGSPELWKPKCTDNTDGLKLICWGWIKMLRPMERK